MANVQFFKTTALPANPVADAFYFVSSGGGDAEMFLTDQAGVERNVGNTAFVTAVANALINQALAAQQTMQVYPTIAARDADQANLGKNTLVVVTDASADPTVGSGSALYVYENGPDTYSKLAEFESLDVVLSWANIQGKPNSTPAQIDNAVAQRHTHANKVDVLDNLSDNGGQLFFNGAAVSQNPPFSANEW